ncbi:MAG: hypothetical protein ACJA2K_001446 [Thalassolituus sp.]|jgi:hypothetical protein|tara:strand:+ start:8300 stop:9154 length:855 start_codon:yes stop_codon:yes gene_type:complete
MICPESWQQALKQPPLSVSTPFTLRLNLARLLRTETRPSAAFISGLRSDSPSTAFLAGYQIAMRFIDPALEPEQWAAFCINEKGVTSTREFTTRLDSNTLSGRKGYVLMAGSNIDWLYVAANSIDGLVCVRVTPATSGVSVVSSSKPQPFLVDIPHGSLLMKDTTVTDTYFKTKVHEELNKPFRFHEDVLCLLAFAGWVCRALGDVSARDCVELQQGVTPLMNAYSNDALSYSLTTLDLFEALERVLDEVSNNLPDSARRIWLRDRAILSLGQKARAIIRSRLL